MRATLLAVLFVACPVIGQVRWVGPDFWLKTELGTRWERRPQPVDCRAHIAEIMCLVDPDPDPDAEMGSVRPCVEGGLDYAHYFEALYDHFPQALQKMFCSLDVINIEKKFLGTAYAGMILDQTGQLKRVQIGIRKSVLDEALDLHTWASWKEQLSFGGIVDGYVLTPGLPVVMTRSDPRVNDFLYFVIAHEFGHLFDFANHLNRFESHECATKEAQDPTVECAMAPGSWGSISWNTQTTPKPRNEFPYRKGLCFYWCNGKTLPIDAILPLYRNLYRYTDFISIYSTANPGDDFADSLAYYLAAELLGMRYRIRAPGLLLPIRMKLYSRLFAPKLTFIAKFLKRNDIQYPRNLRFSPLPPQPKMLSLGPLER